MQRVAFLFREPGANLKSGKDFLSPELRSKWNAFGDSTEQNSGNSEEDFGQKRKERMAIDVLIVLLRRQGM